MKESFCAKCVNYCIGFQLNFDAFEASNVLFQSGFISL